MKIIKGIFFVIGFIFVSAFYEFLLKGFKTEFHVYLERSIYGAIIGGIIYVIIALINFLLRRKYRKLLNILYKYSDCFTFAIGGYPSNFNYKLVDEEIRKAFDTYMVSHLEANDDIEKEYIKYKKTVIKADKENKTLITKTINNLKQINEDLIFKQITWKYANIQYGYSPDEEGGKALVFGYNITEKTKKYLDKVTDIWKWKNKRPDNLVFYKEGKCIFISCVQEKIIYVTNEELYNEIKDLYPEVILTSNEEFHNLKYPYELNNQKDV